MILSLFRWLGLLPNRADHIDEIQDQMLANNDLAWDEIERTVIERRRVQDEILRAEFRRNP